jgi:hypothetical protein
MLVPKGGALNVVAEHRDATVAAMPHRPFFRNLPADRRRDPTRAQRMRADLRGGESDRRSILLHDAVDVRRCETLADNTMAIEDAEDCTTVGHGCEPLQERPHWTRSPRRTDRDHDTLVLPFLIRLRVPQRDLNALGNETKILTIKPDDLGAPERT